MPPKADISDPKIAKFIEQFASISFSGQPADEAVRNIKKAEVLSQLIEKNHLGDKNLDAKGGALVVAASKNPPNDLPFECRDYVVQRIIDGSLTTTDRVTEACKYMAGLSDITSIDKARFDDACGVGVNVTAEDVMRIVELYMDQNSTSIAEQKWNALSPTMTALRSEPALRWAKTLDTKNAVEEALAKRFGPKGKQPAPAKAVKEPKVKAKVADSEIDADAMFKEGFLSRLHKVGDNPQKRPALKEEHVKAVAGNVVTRFPPEPNGFLHIGHSKAIAVDFGYARYHGGQCVLRYDDTNPEAEEQQYFESILEMVRWLGFEPARITYSSDYFQRLYELAVELIKRGKAYVDHSTGEEINAGRGGKDGGPRKENKYSSRPIEESLREFEDMKNGKYKAGTVTLRMKQDLLGSGNPQMWDLIAYRVLNAKHHRTGDTWCIYPTYDFTHCLVDSFENITHSLCTTEFQLSRESYEWLCDALDVYKPRQYEFGRLNLEGTITSKRKILKLVKEGHVQDWDDPRLFTLLALRRRGIPPGAILSFINQLGVTTSMSTIQSKRLDQSVRQHLEGSTPRLMMCLDPVKLTLQNVPDDFYMELERPLHPKAPEFGKSQMPFTKVVYIDRSDFRQEEEEGYLRLAPGKTVGLLNVPFAVTCTSFTTDIKSELVDNIICRYEDEQYKGDATKKGGKTYIQWIAEHAPSKSPVHIDEVRIFNPLFTSANPAGEENYLDHIDKDSLQVKKGAMMEVAFWKVAKTALEQAKKDSKQRNEAGFSEKDSEGAPDRKAKQLYGIEVVRFQAMRIAYFALDNRDADLDAGKVILNRIVSLKEDAAKK